jgi:hypothetical protein
MPTATPSWLGPVLAVASGLPIRVLLAVRTELTPDEAYYWASGRFGRIADHPPLLPWIIGLCDRLQAIPLELRVRLPAIVGSAALALGMAVLTRETDPRCSAAPTIAALLATWLPLPMAGGFLATPDALAMPAMVAALAWGGLANPSPQRTAGTAILVALGGLAKVVVLPVAVLTAAIAAVSPGQTTRGKLRATVWLFPSLLTIPWLLPSVRFQLRHVFVPGPWSPSAALGAVAAFAVSALLLWSPPLVVSGARALGDLPPVYRAVCVSLSGLVLVSAVVRAVPPEPNWWAPAAATILVAAAGTLARSSARFRFWAMTAAIAPTIAAIAHVLHPWLPLPQRLDPAARLHGWASADPPLDAPGLGPYAAAAEHCAYQDRCNEIVLIINNLNQ